MTQYFMIGADGRVYGPVAGDQLRQWRRERRAEGATKIRRENEEEWFRLDEIAELAETPEPGRGLPPPLVEPPVRQGMGKGTVLADTILERGYDLRIGDCFGRGWQLITEQFWLLTGGTWLVMMLFVGLGSLPVLGTAATLVLGFVMFGGVDWLFLKRLRGEPVEMGLVFVGFGKSFVPLMLAGLVATVLTSVGMLLCLAPGIYLLVAWCLFTPLLILDKGLDFWEAMECSRRVVTRHWWPCFGLLLLGILALAGGVLALVIGLLVALPWVTAATVVAYEEIFGTPMVRQLGSAGTSPATTSPEGPVQTDSLAPPAAGTPATPDEPRS